HCLPADSSFTYTFTHLIQKPPSSTLFPYTALPISRRCARRPWRTFPAGRRWIPAAAAGRFRFRAASSCPSSLPERMGSTRVGYRSEERRVGKRVELGGGRGSREQKGADV